nr:MAG TPA: protein of unknown function DUF859 [Caudoviricetes sp.]
MALSGSFNTSGYEGRHWRFSWTATQNVGANTSTISYKVEAAGGSAGWYMCGPCKVVVAGKTVYNNTGRWKQYKGTLHSGTITVRHNNNGTASFSASISSAIYYYADGTGNGSKTWSLNTIPRASQPSVNTWPDTVSSVNIGDSITIHMNKKASFTHKVTATFGNKTEVVTNSCVDNVVWNGFTLAKFAGQIPNATSGTLTFTVDTMNGSKKIGTKTVSVTANLPSTVVPSCSISSLTNTNNSFGCYAKLLSGVKVKPTAAGVYGSTIRTLKISVTDMNDKTASSGTEYTFDPFQKIGSKKITVSATDSRGRSAITSMSITVVDYSFPTARISASRGTGSTTNNFVADDTGDHAKISSIGSVSGISGNTITPILQYKVASQTAWTNIPVSASSTSFNDTCIISVSDTQAYDIRLIVRDKAGREAIATMTLSNGFATMDYKAGGDGIAFGKTANRAGIDCAMLIRILKGMQLMNETTSGGYGFADWYYNNNGSQQKNGTIYAASDGIHVKALNGRGFLDGTWSGSLSDRRMKRDIEPIAQNIIQAVGEVRFVQFRMSAPDYSHEELYVGILAQDLQNAFARHGVEDKLLMLGTRKLNPDDENEYYCIEYTHFLLVRLLYDELQMQDFNDRIEKLEKKLGI